MSEERNAFGQPIGAAVPGWSARERPSRRPILGRYARLEPVSLERHATELYASYREARDDRDWTYLFVGRPQSPQDFESYLAQLVRSEDPLHFVVIDLKTGLAVGTAALMRIEPVHGVIEVGHITFSPRMQRTRLGSEAIFLFMRLVFDELGYRRFEWKCDSLNAPSRAAAERYGFAFEGIFRRAVVYKGRNRDTAWYAVIKEEWPHLRTAFEAWLDPVNFGDDGSQRRSLREIRATLRG
jgi:RimJ/RimL family protein N-acetyltransferase